MKHIFNTLLLMLIFITPALTVEDDPMEVTFPLIPDATSVLPPLDTRNFEAFQEGITQYFKNPVVIQDGGEEEEYDRYAVVEKNGANPFDLIIILYFTDRGANPSLGESVKFSISANINAEEGDGSLMPFSTIYVHDGDDEKTRNAFIAFNDFFAAHPRIPHEFKPYAKYIAELHENSGGED